MAKGQRPLLPPEDDQHLRQLLKTASDGIRQRAQVVLDWQDGLTATETARRTGLSENQVRYLLRLFRQKGLDLFLVDTTPVAQPPAPEPVAAPEPEPEAAGTVAFDDLLTAHNVDMKHAQHIAAQAVTLFDATMSIHRLPGEMRSLLEVSALAHNIAYADDSAKHDVRGRDIILAQPIRGYSDEEQRIIACVVAFHSKKVHADKDPIYKELSDEIKEDVIALAAMLRVADGLDASQSQTTTISDVQVKPEEVAITVEGWQADANGQAAQKKADLWNQHFTQPIRINAVVQPAPQPVDVMPLLSPGLSTSMSVTRAGRAFAEHTLSRIDTLIRRVQAGDTTVLPSLTREASRLNEAIALADAKDFSKDAQWLLESVTEARIAAALADRAVSYADDPDNMGAAAVRDRAQEWQGTANAASKALDVRRYNKLNSDLRQALVEDVDPNEKALITFHVGSILWGQLAALRDVMENGTSVTDALDATRRLQDHLLAFRELLGGEVSQVLDMLAPLEGYLSAIFITQSILDRLVPPPPPVKRGRKPSAPPPPDVAYEMIRNVQVEALNSLADSLPSAWAAVNSPIFRRAFALAVAVP